MGGWSHAVTHRPPATFPAPKIYTKSAKEIYLHMRLPQISPNGLASAIQMVQFFINRAGRKLPERRKKVLQKAVLLLRTELAYLKQYDKFGLSYQPSPVHPPPARDKRIGGRNGFNGPYKPKE